MTSTPGIASPYRWFFPLAAGSGVLGVLWWILFPRLVPTYPGLAHADLMIGGFFLAAAVGFLLTAVPRLTGTRYPSRWEVSTLFAAQCAVFLFGVLQQSRGLHGAVLTVLLLLLRFGAHRVRQSPHALPPTLRMGASGIFAGLVGSSFILVADFVALPAPLVHVARLLFVLGLPLGLMLGIGTRLIPALTGLSSTPILPSDIAPAPQQRYLQGEGYAAIFLLSFVFDAWISAPLPFGYLLRALLTSEILLRHWHIGRLPPRRGVLVWCLYLCAWALLVGSWAPIVWPAYTIHLEHITFIGGISLMTFAVSTRVTLSHGGHDLAPEQRSRRLLGMAALLGIALLTRLSAPFTAEYFAHLSYASVAWIAAMSCWALLIVPHLRETDRS